MIDIDWLSICGLIAGFGSIIVAQNRRMWKKICGLTNIAYQKHPKEAIEQDL